MAFSFQAEPHEEAAKLIRGKAVVPSRVFYEMLPEIRARMFTISGIESANVLQRARDTVAELAEGTPWDSVKADLLDQISPYFESEEAAIDRSELVLRVNGFQMFSAASWRSTQADADTTHLQYIHGNAEVPTPSHEALDGLILPKDDPFWETHYGPWGHPGCVCWARGMNPDQVDEEKAADTQRAPDAKRVMEGPALRKLNEGQLVRDGRAYDVMPPRADNGEPKFLMAPGDLTIPMKEIEKRYDPEVWKVFETFAKKNGFWDSLQRVSANG